jgi:hypothetical protein
VFALPAVFVCGALLLFLLHVRGYTDLRMGIGLVRVSSWVSYVTGAVVVAIAARASFVRFNATAAIVEVLALVLFCLSLHTVEFDSLTVNLTEYWVGVCISSYELTGLNDEGYCYDSRWFSIGFRRIGTAQEHVYFRGVWLSSFMDADNVLRAAGVQPCRLQI